MRYLLALILLLLWGTPCQAGTLQQQVLLNAQADLGVVEATNHNDGVRIEQVLRWMGLPKGQPYCASFVVWWYDHAGRGQVLPRYGRVALLRQYVADHEVRYRVIPAEDVALGIAKLQPADMVYWAHGRVAKKNGRVDFNGHTGIVTRQIDRRTVATIEANTQPGNSGDQREGGGVYVRVRKVSLEGSFRVLDFGRVRP